MFSRRHVVAGAVTAVAGSGFTAVPLRRLAAAALASPSHPEPWALRLIAAAEAQVGLTVHYDPAYVRLPYPMGDLDRSRGVCTDVIVRAYRDAFGLDLQRLVHEDMARAFAAYPRLWGLSRPDPSIDHRRVPNLETFLTREGARLVTGERPADFLPGDLVTQVLPGNLAHIAIVTHRRSPDGQRPLVAHNIGRGARLEDTLFAFTLTGQFRFPPAA